MSKTVRRPKEDKILTKTMINNYAKNDLLPPPVKKKYTKEHMLLLIFIYYYKGILAIGDIQKLLNPLTERFFGKEDGFQLEDVYDEVFRLENEQVQVLKEDVSERFRISKGTFENAPDDSKDFLQQFAFICMLSFDVYVKKLLIEKLIDGLVSDKEEQKPEKTVKEKTPKDKTLKEKTPKEKTAKETP